MSGVLNAGKQTEGGQNGVRDKNSPNLDTADRLNFLVS